MKKSNKGFSLAKLPIVIFFYLFVGTLIVFNGFKIDTKPSKQATIISSIKSYIYQVEEEVNNLSFNFTDSTKIYAIPIECVDLNRKTNTSFGEWLPANNDFFAYVLVTYDEENTTYTYGFTFKDSMGYGMYPTTLDRLNSTGSQIKPNLNISFPKSGDITSLTTNEIWEESGFDIEGKSLEVLNAEIPMNETVDAKTTCRFIFDTEK